MLEKKKSDVCVIPWTSQYKVHVTPDTAHKTVFDGVDNSLPAHQGQPSHVSLH